MATHGYTCVNPVLVLFYTCSFVFFQFYTCVTPFFSGFAHGYTWLHMATHPLHIWEKFQDRQLYGLRFCHSLGGRGLNARHLIQINPSNWPFKLKTPQNVLLSTGFLYDDIIDGDGYEPKWCALFGSRNAICLVFKIHSEWYRYLKEPHLKQCSNRKDGMPRHDLWLKCFMIGCALQ